jgi:hypothetical protein
MSISLYKILSYDLVAYPGFKQTFYITRESKIDIIIEMINDLENLEVKTENKESHQD